MLELRSVGTSYTSRRSLGDGEWAGCKAGRPVCGMRPLSIPTMRDRAMQALYLLALEPIAEVRADPNSYGFRTNRSTADALGQCFCVFGQKYSAEAVFDADIKSCFDRISHPWLIEHVPMDKEILRKWLAAARRSTWCGTRMIFS